MNNDDIEQVVAGAWSQTGYRSDIDTAGMFIANARNVISALHKAGYDIVKVGDVPPWMEAIDDREAGGPTLGLYRLKAI